jgi:hypothetical protein
LKDLAQISLPTYGDYLRCRCPQAKNKKQMQENFHLFLANISTAATAPVAVTFMIRVEEKKENHMVDIKWKQF